MMVWNEQKARQSDDHVQTHIFRISSQGAAYWVSNKSTCLCDKVQPILCSPGHHLVDLIQHVSLFLPPSLLYTLDFGGHLSLLFAVNFCRLHQGSSPWIFISPLTPLNVNSSFPVLLFISVAWWFDHAGNTRLAIALSLVLPQGQLLQKCYCLCFLTLHFPTYSPPQIFCFPSISGEPGSRDETNKTSAPIF